MLTLRIALFMGFGVVLFAGACARDEPAPPAASMRVAEHTQPAPEGAHYMDGWAGAVFAEGISMPEATLVDRDGKAFDLQEDTQGKIVVLSVGYTSCPDICPLHMANLNAGIQGLPKDERVQVEVVFISVDPERDTPERLEEWISHFDPRYQTLLAAPDELDGLQRAFGFTPAYRVEHAGGDYAMAHASYSLVFDRDGVARLGASADQGAEAWSRDLARLVAGDVPSM